MLCWVETITRSTCDCLRFSSYLEINDLCIKVPLKLQGQLPQLINAHLHTQAHCVYHLLAEISMESLTSL